MAVGDRTPKKLGQAALNTTAVNVVTGQANYRTEVTEIWIANTNTTTTRKVTLYAFGTAAGNTLVQEIELAAKASTQITTHIVLLGTETLSAIQDVGTDVTVTAFGIEEQLV